MSFQNLNMPTVCAIAGCASRADKAKVAGEILSFHRFPKSEKLRRIWVLKCKRGDAFNPSTSHVCSAHFSLEDFETNFRAELMGEPVRKKLKPGSIPTLNLPWGRSKKVCQARQERMKLKEAKRAHKEIIDAALKEVSSSGKDDFGAKSDSLDVTAGPSNRPDREPRNYKELYFKTVAANNVLERQLESCYGELNEAKKKLQQSSGNTKKAVEKEAVQLLSSRFSENQISMLLGEKKRIRWTREDISKAFTIRCLSKPAFTYLRNELHYPLPGVSCLQKWASQINLHNGLLDDVLRVMHIVGRGLDHQQRLTVLCFAEMKVSSSLEYDAAHDEILGPFSQMNVIMARGLCSKWKQPVFVGFDEKITKDVLCNVIGSLHKVGYRVLACVSDCRRDNVGLWKQLGVSFEIPYFVCPSSGKNIYYFPDAPHLLKSLRNWLLDTGFLLNNRPITKEPLQQLMEWTSTEVYACHQLTDAHLTCEGSQRQSVKLAAQLISRPTAAALRHSKLGNDPTAQFLELMNNWFDIMNVSVPDVSEGTPFTLPYGRRIDEQKAVLEEVFGTMSNMRCIGRKNLQVFQKGILMSVNSLRLLYDDLKEEGLQYILTSKLNQDCLEDFFSQIRSRSGSDDHPTLLNVLHAMRTILLGKNPDPLDRQEVFVLASALSSIEDQQMHPMHQTEESPTFQSSDTDSSDTDMASKDSSRSHARSTIPGATKETFGYWAGQIAKKLRTTNSCVAQDIKKDSDHEYALLPWVIHL